MIKSAPIVARYDAKNVPDRKRCRSDVLPEPPSPISTTLMARFGVRRCREVGESVGVGGRECAESVPMAATADDCSVDTVSRSEWRRRSAAEREVVECGGGGLRVGVVEEVGATTASLRLGFVWDGMIVVPVYVVVWVRLVLMRGVGGYVSRDRAVAPRSRSGSIYKRLGSTVTGLFFTSTSPTWS